MTNPFSFKRVALALLFALVIWCGWKVDQACQTDIKVCSEKMQKYGGYAVPQEEEIK